MHVRVGLYGDIRNVWGLGFRFWVWVEGSGFGFGLRVQQSGIVSYRPSGCNVHEFRLAVLFLWIKCLYASLRWLDHFVDHFSHFLHLVRAIVGNLVVLVSGSLDEQFHAALCPDGQSFMPCQ